MFAKRIFAIAALIVGLVPAIALAQESADKTPHWGVSGNFGSWQSSDQVVKALTNSDVVLSGPSFNLGIVRGSQEGGEWGIDFQRRNISNSSMVVDRATTTLPVAGQHDGQQFVSTDTYAFASGSSMYGLAVHRFQPFGPALKHRVQFGVNLGVGATWIGGSVTLTQLRYVINDTNTGVTLVRTTTTVTASDAFQRVNVPMVLPSGKVEGAVSVLVVPGLKLRVGSGFDFPGYNLINVSLTYLIGARSRQTVAAN